MLRQAFRDRLTEAMKARDSRTVSTVRLILAGLKERDVAAPEVTATEAAIAADADEFSVTEAAFQFLDQRRAKMIT